MHPPSVLTAAAQTNAIKAFAITVLGRLAKKYPEIIPELQVVIEDQLSNQSPAFKGRAEKLFKELNIGQ